MNAEDKIASAFDAIGEAATSEAAAAFAMLRSDCQSPIEEIMLAHLMALRIPDDLTAAQNPGRLAFPLFHYSETSPWFQVADEAFLCFRQAHVHSDLYRADFLLILKFGDRDDVIRIVVECDGHEFHERTKEQARADRLRDRNLTLDGYYVLRFTGSEIWATPRVCVAEIGRLIGKLGRRRLSAGVMST